MPKKVLLVLLSLVILSVTFLMWTVYASCRVNTFGGYTGCTCVGLEFETGMHNPNTMCMGIITDRNASTIPLPDTTKTSQ